MPDAFTGLCVAAGLGKPIPEYRFHPTRRFRFDWAFPQWLVAYEREGASWTAGRHTSGAGFRRDCEKYSEAAILGWVVVRATADMERSGLAMNLLKRAIEAQQRRMGA